MKTYHLKFQISNPKLIASVNGDNLVSQLESWKVTELKENKGKYLYFVVA